MATETNERSDASAIGLKERAGFLLLMVPIASSRPRKSSLTMKAENQLTSEA